MINDCAYVNQTLASLLMKNDVDVKLQLRTRNLFDKTILLAIKLYFLKADIIVHICCKIVGLQENSTKDH